METFLGEIMLFAGNFAPVGWAACEGQLLSVAENEALFVLLGTTYGGDGFTNFGLPDLRGRVPNHVGKGTDISEAYLGGIRGTERNTLTQAEMPSHTHAATATVSPKTNSNPDENAESPEGNYLRKFTGEKKYATVQTFIDGKADNPKQTGQSTVSITVNQTGGNAPYNNIQPTLAMMYCIAVTGIFPSRP